MLIAVLSSICVGISFGQTQIGAPAPGSANTVGSLQETLPQRSLGRVIQNALAVDSNAQYTEAKYAMQNIGISGSKNLPAEVLQSMVVSAKTGLDVPARCSELMSVPELKAGALSLTKMYRQKGFAVAVVYIPEQDVTACLVTFNIKEGTLDSFTVSGFIPRNVEKATDVSNSALAPAPSKPLMSENIERPILLDREVTRSNAEATLQPSTKFCSTKLELNVEGERCGSCLVRPDNCGSCATGEYQVNAQVNVRSVAKQGDLLNASFVTTDSSDTLSGFRLSSELPVGVNGWHLVARNSYSSYTLGHLANQALKYSIDPSALGVFASYALPRRFESSSDICFGFNTIDIADKLGVMAQDSLLESSLPGI